MNEKKSSWTYSKSEAQDRNYEPDAPNNEPVLEPITIRNGQPAQMPIENRSIAARVDNPEFYPRDEKLAANGLLPFSKNNDVDNNDPYPFKSPLHTWENSVSGTGTGHPYWSYNENPFRA